VKQFVNSQPCRHIHGLNRANVAMLIDDVVSDKQLFGLGEDHASCRRATHQIHMLDSAGKPSHGDKRTAGKNASPRCMVG
jgi:hypothetical protein